MKRFKKGFEEKGHIRDKTMKIQYTGNKDLKEEKYRKGPEQVLKI